MYKICVWLTLTCCVCNSFYLFDFRFLFVLFIGSKTEVVFFIFNFLHFPFNLLCDSVLIYLFRTKVPRSIMFCLLLRNCRPKWSTIFWKMRKIMINRFDLFVCFLVYICFHLFEITNCDLILKYVALKHSPSKRKSISKAAQRSSENESDSHREWFYYLFYI